MEICFENKYVYASRNNTWDKSIYEKQLTLQFFPQFIKGERKRAKKKIEEKVRNQRRSVKFFSHFLCFSP